MDDRLVECLEWAAKMAKQGLVREDQIVDAAVLRASVLAEEEAGLRPREKALPEHRAARAKARIREKVRRSKARRPDGPARLTVEDGDE